MRTEYAQSLGRLIHVVLIAALGYGCSLVFGLDDKSQTATWTVTAAIVLATGLYLAVLGIDRTEAKDHWRIVAVAVTIGVVGKWLLIFALCFALDHDWRYILLAMAVAQIDPLQVAALLNNSRMSARARTLVTCWASFDDPVTTVLAVLLLSLWGVINPVGAPSGIGWSDAMASVLPIFVVLLLLAIALQIRRRYKTNMQLQLDEDSKNTLVLSAIVIGSIFRMFSLAALAGWFVRPRWLQGKVADRLLQMALVIAMLMVGVLLSGGIDWTGGVLLGCATYCSQIIAAWIIMYFMVIRKAKNLLQRQQAIRDTAHISLAQQNGLTAVVLALNLEPFLAGSVATVAVCVLVVNVLNLVGNMAFDVFTNRQRSSHPAELA